MTRAKWLGWLAVLGVLGFLSVASAEPKPSGAPVDRVACARAPGVPDHVDIWVVLGSGRIFYDKPLFHKNLPSDAVVYVYKPNDPICRKKQSTAAVTQAAPEPKKTAPPEKVVEPKKDDKTKPQDSPKAVASATSAEAQDLEARRQRAGQIRATDEPQEAISGAEIAKKKRQKASLLPTVRHSRKATPMMTSACPTCGTKQAPAVGLSLCGAAKATAGAPAAPAENPKTASVREPILTTLHALERAKSGTDKQTNRQKLRGHFERVSPLLAEPFQGMLLLDPKDPVALTFRRVLATDPLKKELIEILEKKYVCAPPPPPPPAAAPTPPAVQASADPWSITLPAVSLSDKEAFEVFHKQVKEWIDRVDTQADGLALHLLAAMADYKKYFKLTLVPLLRLRLTVAQKASEDALKEADATKKAELLKTAGAAYEGVVILTEVLQLQLAMASVADGADRAGAPTEVLKNSFDAMGKDEELFNLTLAARTADAQAMANALPAGIKRFEHYLTGLEKFIVAANNGAFWSKRVIAAANAMMICVSVVQAARALGTSAGGPSPPMMVVGVLPGGVALSSRISAAALAESVEAIRRLIAIGALDVGIVAGIGMLGGGGPSISVPELQRPTSLSVKKPGQGTSTQTSQSPGTPATKVATPFPRKNLRGVSLKWLQRNKPSGWRQEPADNGRGWKWLDENGTERLRFMRPNGQNPGASQWSRQANGYFRWKNAANEELNIDGNVVSKSSKQFDELTHIMYEGL